MLKIKNAANNKFLHKIPIKFQKPARRPLAIRFRFGHEMFL